ncbi:MULTISPECIES: hypothetical protein [unclassified Marinobacter]|jgi:hypothetical protein|nr:MULTISPECIES: hypothetical protein [unclassified Marinobacter]
MNFNRILVVASAVSSALFLSACAITPDATQESVTTESLLQGGE